jgi:hypothetical protein
MPLSDDRYLMHDKYRISLLPAKQTAIIIADFATSLLIKNALL